MIIMFLCEVRAFIRKFRINCFKPERMQRPDMERSVFFCFLYVIRCEFNIMNKRFQYILTQNIKIQIHEIVACCQKLIFAAPNSSDPKNCAFILMITIQNME